MLPAISLHFQPKKGTEHTTERAKDSLRIYTEFLYCGEDLDVNKDLGDLRVPHIGFTRNRTHLASSKITDQEREKSNEKAIALAKELQLGASIDCYIGMDVVPGAGPLLVGLLPEESTNPRYRARTELVRNARKVEILVANTQVIAATAMWTQGLFELRHMFDADPNGTVTGLGTDFFFFAKEKKYNYDLDFDDEDQLVSFSPATHVGYNLISDNVQVPFPPWLVGRRLSNNIEDKSGPGGNLTIDQVQPLEVNRMPVLPHRHAFESFIFIALLRDISALGDLIDASFDASVPHDCRFDQVHHTRFFRIGVRISGTETSTPFPGTWVIIDHSGTIFDGIGSSADTQDDLDVFATTKERGQFSSTGPEHHAISVSGTRRLIEVKAKAVKHTIQRLPPPRVGYLDPRLLLWGGRNPPTGPQDLLADLGIPPYINNNISRLYQGLDNDQRKAFRASLLEVNDGLALIDGPGGTGKSETLIAIVLAAAISGKKIRVVMPSNAAIEQFLVRLLKKTAQMQLESMVNPTRLYTAAVERTASGRDEADREPHSHDAAFISNIMTEEERNFVVEHTIGLATAMNSRALFWARVHAGLDPSDPLNDDPSDPDIARKYLTLRASVLSSHVEGALSRKDRNLFEEMEFAIKCKVCDATNILLHTPARTGAKDIAMYRADMVVFDEAGAAGVGELCQVLEINDPLEVLILAGDTNQLPPYDPGAMTGTSEFSTFLHRPLLELASVVANRKAHCLNSQYRSHPELRHIITPLVYGRSFVNAYQCRDPGLIAGMMDFLSHGPYRSSIKDTTKREVVFDVNSVDVRPAAGTSRYNPGSLGAMCRFLLELCRWVPDSERSYVIDGQEVGPRRVTFAEIGIVATHLNHCGRIKQTLKRMADAGLFMDQVEELKLGTVDTFQGSERAIMLIDFVIARQHRKSYASVADKK